MVSRVYGSTYTASRTSAVYNESAVSGKQNRFIDVLTELKLAGNEGNRITAKLTPSGDPSDYQAGIFDGNIARWEDCGVYEAPEQPELIQVIRPDPAYPESIYDIPITEWFSLFAAAMDACGKINKEGLTKGELCREITAVFESYLGKDFLEPRYTQSACGSERADNGWTYADNIYSSFKWLLDEYGVEYSNTDARIEAAGYSGMSKDEIKAAVREKYPEVMTLRECMVMGWELNELGVIPQYYVTSLENLLNITIKNVSPEAAENVKEIHEMLLDLPADFDQFVCSYKKYEVDVTGAYIRNENKLDPVTRILNWFRVSDNNAYTADILGEIRALM